IRSEDEIQVDALPLTHLHGFIALVIGAKHTTKKLPFEKLVELCNLLPYPIMLLGGPEDAETGDALAKTDPVKISNSCGKYSISQSASLLKLSKLVITHDTGLMHIAAAFRKKIISVWGNTVPAFGMSPYYGHAAIYQAMVEINNLNCRPCSKIGFEKCPKGHFKCMNLINVKDILKITEGL
ncbi:MAG: glycosyltransferase family 9 protein, partial [Chitinophagales bacterium]